ncbi:carboxypeptidase regulatory-like domain-containing protein, partial [Staphylococcus aureus]
MRKLAVFLTLAMLFMAQLNGQTNRTVTGKVTDESGNPLVGVSVTAVGTGKTTVTDAKGNYSIQVTD